MGPLRPEPGGCGVLQRGNPAGGQSHSRPAPSRAATCLEITLLERPVEMATVSVARRAGQPDSGGSSSSATGETPLAFGVAVIRTVAFDLDVNASACVRTLLLGGQTSVLTGLESWQGHGGRRVVGACTIRLRGCFLIRGIGRRPRHGLLIHRAICPSCPLLLRQVGRTLSLSLAIAGEGGGATKQARTEQEQERTQQSGIWLSLEQRHMDSLNQSDPRGNRVPGRSTSTSMDDSAHWIPSHL